MATQESMVSSSVDTSPLLSMDSTSSYLTRSPQHSSQSFQHSTQPAAYNQDCYNQQQHYQEQHFYQHHQYSGSQAASSYSPADYYQPNESYIQSYQQQPSVSIHSHHQDQPTSTLSTPSLSLEPASHSGSLVLQPQQQQVSYISTSYSTTQLNCYSPTPTLDSYYNFPNGPSAVYAAQQQQQQQQQFNTYVSGSYLQLSEVSEKRGGNENYGVKVDTCESSSVNGHKRQEQQQQQMIKNEQSNCSSSKKSATLEAVTSANSNSTCQVASSSSQVTASKQNIQTNHQTTKASSSIGKNNNIGIVARRKNATRETTAILKDWLFAHTHNPYPTKGEKIMLSVMTKMNLTQVSTWFANARRRMKKENKLLAWALQRPPPNSVDVDRGVAAARLRYFIEKHAKLMSQSTMLALASRLQGGPHSFLWQLSASASASASAASTPSDSSSPVANQRCSDTPSSVSGTTKNDLRLKCETNSRKGERHSEKQAQFFPPTTDLEAGKANE